MEYMEQKMDDQITGGLMQKRQKEMVFYLCKCGEEIESFKNADPHFIVCPKCKRRGWVEKQPF